MYLNINQPFFRAKILLLGSVAHAKMNSVKIDFSQIDQVTACLKALSNPDRLKILCLLLEGELNVQQIEDRSDIHQPTLSQQLTVLRKHQLVMTRREGKQIFYQISDPKILVIMQTLHDLYCEM